MKRLYKSRTDKKIDGVCAGIAEYFEVDPVLVRVLAVLLLFMGGVAFLAYIIGMIVIPRKPFDMETPATETQEPQNTYKTYEPPVSVEPKKEETNYSSVGALIVGIILVTIGAFTLADNLNIFNHFHFWRWLIHNCWDFMVPAIFIIAGIALLAKSKKEKE